MWRDFLRALGVGSTVPVQPDISGHTILNLLQQTDADPELMIPAFGALYEDVTSDPAEPQSGRLKRIHIDLGRDRQPLASLFCSYTAGQPIGCTFSYWDPEAEVDAFLQQASTWVTANIGPLPEGSGSGNVPEWRSDSMFANSSISGVTLRRLAEGDESHAEVEVRFVRVARD